MRNKLAMLGIILIPSLIYTCTHTPEQIKARQELINRFNNIGVANHQMVQGCEYLGEVESSTTWKKSGLVGRIRGGNSIQRCKKQAKYRASQVGATHIVWTNITASEGNAYVSGIAYKCVNAEDKIDE